MIHQRSKTVFGLGLVLLMATSSIAQVATYDITLDSRWTQATHPYPPFPHFSPLIGALHNDTVSFWEPGGLASRGIERMAEVGLTGPLRNEINATGDAAQAISGSGVNGDDNTTIRVEVDLDRSLLTLVTMVAPSPDWFVGLSGFDLRAGGFWNDSFSLPLTVWDAGTDSGSNFTSSDSDTVPKEPIQVLGAPLDDTPPLAYFLIDLVSVDGLTGDFDADGDYSEADLDALTNAIVSQSDSPAFDLNGDGQVNPVDLTAWLAEAGAAELPGGSPYLSGDSNLDGFVDVTDFNRWNDNKFTTGGGWSGGDFNADGFTDVTDFNEWNNNKFTASGLLATVPEPSTGWWLLLPLLWLTRRAGSLTS